MSKLVIVESPAKAKTIGSILGDGYVVKYSKGHIRDLPDRRMGVDPNNGFAPFYVIDRTKEQLIAELRALAKDADLILLATDHDREGEAIAWHLLEVINPNRDIPFQRIHFHEVTREAIMHALDEPHSVNSIDMDGLYAQQARRILDRLVGYSISPLLRRKIRRGLAAGRVQSAAVRIIVEREREILKFELHGPEEYWTIETELKKHDGPNATRKSFRAKLVGYPGKDKIDIGSEQEVEEISVRLAGADYRITKVDTREVKRQPAPPFTTSTLQQEAASKLHFTVGRTMSIAQQLYEGTDVGDGPVGLITYMRTDSTRIADSAITETRQFIEGKFGANYLSQKARTFPGKARGEQGAHEGIRPTSVYREPSLVRSYLKTAEQFRLYELIWQRMVASQMKAASSNRTMADIEAVCADSGPKYALRISKAVVTFPGFMCLYSESNEEDSKEDADGIPMPSVKSGDILDFIAFFPEQHFTKPPPRFTEAALVKTLEQNGIGRPSTYAPTIASIQREYVTKQGAAFRPTEAASVVNDVLCEFFPEIVDIQFTARMEQELDEIARGNCTWVSVLEEFHTTFQKSLASATDNMKSVRLPDRVTTETCPICLTKYGLARRLLIKKGPTGAFLGCPGYKDKDHPCDYTHPYRIRTGVRCPNSPCDGELLELMNRRGRVFYGCSNYPECKFKTNNRPIPEPCPECGSLLTMSRNQWARCVKCKHQVQIEQEDIQTDMPPE
jgi:DNA topoisomerase-1